MATDRIGQMFTRVRAEERTGLILFLTVGFPDLDATIELVPALVEAGADAIELGVPFSDPLAEGPTIQASSFAALRRGVTLSTCLDMAKALRAKIPETPLLLMGYYNPIFNFGLPDLCQVASNSGIDGLIVPDLPFEESKGLNDQCRRMGMHLVPLLAPTSTNERIAKTCAVASGFIYCVSVTGVTGARQTLPSDMPNLANRIARHTNLPLAVGFGISKKEHVENVGKFADAAIVGSALINKLQDSPRELMIENACRLVEELKGPRSPYSPKEVV